MPKILLFLTTMFFLSCAQNNYREKAYQDMKDFVLNEDYSGVSYLLFFETDIKNQITYISVFGLQRDLLYSDKYKGKGAREDLFKQMMSGKIQLSCEDFRHCFNLSPTITEEYKKHNFNEFLKKYTTFIQKDNTYIINPVSYDDKLTIAYYFYQHNYYTLEDDYTGHFTSRRDNLYPKTEIINEDDLQEIEE